MRIEKDCVVTLTYQVHNEDGVLIDESSTESPLEYLHGHDGLIKGLEMALDGHQIGDHLNVVIEPDDAYGSFDENLVQRIPKDAFEDNSPLEVGMRFIITMEDETSIPVEITDIEQDFVVVDGNHPLAGQTLRFNIDIMDIREATDEEKSQGHLHQCCGGHNHGDTHECCGGHHHDDDHECCGGHNHDDDHECCGKHANENDNKGSGCGCRH